jgi:hypothetical protein
MYIDVYMSCHIDILPTLVASERGSTHRSRLPQKVAFRKNVLARTL